MKFNRYFVIPAILATISCAKEPGQEASMHVQPAAAAEQPPEKNSTANTGTKTEQSALALRGGAFADDGAGKLLSDLLTPGSPAFRVPLPQKKPRERPLPLGIAQPEPAAAANALTPIRCPSPAIAEMRPIALFERVAAEIAPLIIAVPNRIEFPIVVFSTLPAADVKQPVLLPILARRSVDRASLEDPAADFTAQSIVNNKLPLRSRPAPFVKVVLPDPFENAEAVKVKIAIKEDPLTAIGNPPPPPRN